MRDGQKPAQRIAHWRRVPRQIAAALPDVQREGREVKPDHYTRMVLKVLGAHPKGLQRRQIAAALFCGEKIVKARLAKLKASGQVLSVGKTALARYCLAANKALAELDVTALAAETEVRRKARAVLNQRRLRADKRAAAAGTDWQAVQRVVPAAAARRPALGFNSVWAWAMAATERRA